MPNLSRLVRASLKSGSVAVSSLLFLLLVSSPVMAQQLPGQPGAPAPGAPDSIEQIVAEYQEKQQRFGQLQNEAFQSSQELQARQAAISEMVVDALFESHPQAEVQIDRLETLQEEAFEAQQRQDAERLGALIEEASELQRQLQAAQDQVLQQEAVRTAIESFEADMMTAMLAIDPEAEELMERLDELSAILSGATPPGL